MDPRLKRITDEYISGRMTKEEFEQKKHLFDEIQENETKTESKVKVDSELKFWDCVRDGFILSIISFLIFALYIFSQGWFLESPGIFAFLILGFGLLLGIVFFTFIIFTPIVFVIRKLILPKIKEL